MFTPLPDVDVAWMAGLFEGEGCFTFSGGSVRATLAMTDEDVVVRFGDLVGKRVREDRKPSLLREGIKAMYEVRLSGRDAVEFMALVKPHMGSRRQARIEELMGRYYNSFRQRKALGLATAK